MKQHWLRAEAASVCRAAGLEADADQAAALDAIFGREPGPARSVTVIGPGAPAVLRMAAIGWAFLAGERVLWCARTLDAAEADFRDLLAVTDSPVLRPHALKIRLARGAQRIETAEGGEVRFGARRSFRGASASRMVVAGADSLTWREAYELWPVMAGREDAQMVYGAAELAGEVLGVHVRDAVAAGNPGVAIAVTS